MPSRGGRDRSPPGVLASEDDGGVLFAVRRGGRARRAPPGERIGCRSRYLWMIRADMKRIWCAISSHGFGHAAQAVPVLNELGRRVSGLTAILRTSVPAVGLCNLSWDGVLKLLQEPGRHEQVDVIRRIQESYSLADLMIRIAPGIPMEAFRTIVDVGPVAELTTPDPSLLRAVVGAEAHERVVLVAFGGIALNGLPFERLARMNGYRFVVSGPVPDGSERIRSSASIPMAFGSLLASADLIVTKPGYSTVVKAVAYRTPVVYVRRYNFADEAVLVDYLHRYGLAVELSAGDFTSGFWGDAPPPARAAPPPPPRPPPTRAPETAPPGWKKFSKGGRGRVSAP